MGAGVAAAPWLLFVGLAENHERLGHVPRGTLTPWKFGLETYVGPNLLFGECGYFCGAVGAAFLLTAAWLAIRKIMLQPAAPFLQRQPGFRLIPDIRQFRAPPRKCDRDSMP